MLWSDLKVLARCVIGNCLYSWRRKLPRCRPQPFHHRVEHPAQLLDLVFTDPVGVRTHQGSCRQIAPRAPKHTNALSKCAHLANAQHHPLPYRPAESRCPQRSGAATKAAELGGRVMGDRTGKQANKEQTCATHFFSGSRSSSAETGINRLTVSKEKQRTYSGPCRTCGNRVPWGSKMVRCCIFSV